MLHLKCSIVEVAKPFFERLEQRADSVVALQSKEFWTTRELVERGWTVKQLDELVATGRLLRINTGGSAGFKYSSIQLITIIDNFYGDLHFTPPSVSRRKQG